MWENPFKTFRHWHFKFISARGVGKERERRENVHYSADDIIIESFKNFVSFLHS
jgi:hypothetical protein